MALILISSVYESAILIVTSPDVPPPDKPVPAVTPVMSPGFGATHSNPVAVAELTLSMYPEVDAAERVVYVPDPVATITSPWAVNTALSIKFVVFGAIICQAEPV